jgi:hypothetical protein
MNRFLEHIRQQVGKGESGRVSTRLRASTYRVSRR